jgi:hypothetical protein
MGLKKKLFGGKKEKDVSVKDRIVELLEESAAAGRLDGQTVEAMAAIYEHPPRSPSSGLPVPMPPQQRLAQMFIDSHKQAGFINAKLSLAPNAVIDMRELRREESRQIIFLNGSLASNLAEHFGEKGLRNCKAISLRGDTPAFGIVWFAIVAR